MKIVSSKLQHPPQYTYKLNILTETIISNLFNQNFLAFWLDPKGTNYYRHDSDMYILYLSQLPSNVLVFFAISISFIFILTQLCCQYGSFFSFICNYQDLFLGGSGGQSGCGYSKVFYDLFCFSGQSLVCDIQGEERAENE